MDEVVDKITSLLRRAFPGSETELDVVGSDTLYGYLIWDGFVGRAQIERQKQLSKVLRESLGDEERALISALLTLTPQEKASIDRELELDFA